MELGEKEHLVRPTVLTTLNCIVNISTYRINHKKEWPTPAQLKWLWISCSLNNVLFGEFDLCIFYIYGSLLWFRFNIKFWLIRVMQQPDTCLLETPAQLATESSVWQQTAELTAILSFCTESSHSKWGRRMGMVGGGGHFALRSVQ